MADLPISLEPRLAPVLLAALDVEGKILRALDALGPIADRDVVLVGGGETETTRLAALGARLRPVEAWSGSAWDLDDDAADAIVAAWSAFRGVVAEEVAEAERVLRPGGRLLVVHDYGRDDVSRLHGQRPEYGAWSKRTGPFLTSGFRVRVLHCFWTFDSIETAQSFLGEAFGDVGRAVGAEMKRPRLTYNVAIYHRTFGEPAAGEPSAPVAALPAG